MNLGRKNKIINKPIHMYTQIEFLKYNIHIAFNLTFKLIICIQIKFFY